MRQQIRSIHCANCSLIHANRSHDDVENYVQLSDHNKDLIPYQLYNSPLEDEMAVLDMAHCCLQKIVVACGQVIAALN